MFGKKKEKDTFRKLRLFNVVMGFLHLVQGLVMLWLSNDFKLPVNTSFLQFDVATRTAAPVTEKIFDVRIGPLVAVFLFLSAIAHFILASNLVNEWYNKNLKKGINYVRWYEYALSSSVMIVVIAMLCGIFDLGALILIFSINAIMNLCGLIMEVHNQTTKRTNWLSYIVGCFAGIVPWIVIALYFFGAVSKVGDVIPKFVNGILVSLFLFFNVFAVNMFLQYKQVGKWKDYLFGEKVYIVLSLVAKSLLAWQVFSGTLRPD